MNPLTYENKRAHWKATWYAIAGFRERAELIGEPLLAWMTPARFDVLYAIWMHHAFEHMKQEEAGLDPVRRIPMATLRKTLGLAGSTVSRIAHRLDEIGLVHVVRDDVDRRRVSVVLTDDGIAALQLAIEWITTERIGMRAHIERYVQEAALDGVSREGPPAELRQRVLGRLCTIIDRARTLARFLGSGAIPIYDSRIVSDIPNPDRLFPDD